MILPPRRSALALTLAAVLLPTFVVTGPAAAQSEGNGSAERDLPSVVSVNADEFSDAARELPAGLSAAIERDTGLSAAEYLAHAEAGDAARDVVDALAEVVDVRGSEMQGAELVVYVADSAAADVVEQTGATAVIGEQSVRDVSGIALEPAFDLRGGENHTYDGFRCTTGFVGTNAANATQLLTAGHCTNSSEAVSRAQYRSQNAPYDYAGANPSLSGLTTLGPGLSGSYEAGNGYDHGLITLSNPGNWTALPQITTWGGGGGSNTQSPLTIRDARAPFIGETACKSGATTGWTCGPIFAVNQLACVEGSAPSCTGGYVVNGVFADICMRGGDSGGPVVVGTTAIAVNSASSVMGNASCTSNDIGVFAPLYSFGSVSSENPYGNRSAATKYHSGAWEISVGVQSPTFSNTSAGANRFTSTTLSGSIPSASSRHTMSVTIDGSSVFSPTVNSAGQWSVNVGSLAPGRRTAVLQAGWGQRSASPTVTATWLNATMSRFAGPDRYAAAASISASQFAPGVQKVFVATGDNFPDALAAGPVAASFGAPLLLTPRSNFLPASVAQELDRLNPQQIVVIGGTTSMPPDLVSAMSVYASNTAQPTVRINGQTRYDVSLELLRYAGFTNVDRVWVVTGNGFADALSVSAVAAAEVVPVILVPGTNSSLSPDFAAAISALNPDAISIGGGPVSVSPGIASQLAGIAPTTRFGGADRFEASVNINNSVHSASTVAYIANGLNYPDALSGGVVAGLVDAPLFIGYPWCVPSSVVDRMLELSIHELRILGGTASQSVAVENLVRC